MDSLTANRLNVSCLPRSTLAASLPRAREDLRSSPARAGRRRLRCMTGSPLPMRLLEPGRVTLFVSLFKSLQVGCSRRILELFSRALLLEVLLSRHVQLPFPRQRRAARRFLSGPLADFISGAYFRRCAASRAMSTKHRDATHDDRRCSNQHSETHRLELSVHNSR